MDLPFTMCMPNLDGTLTSNHEESRIARPLLNRSTAPLAIGTTPILLTPPGYAMRYT